MGAGLCRGKKTAFYGSWERPDDRQVERIKSRKPDASVGEKEVEKMSKFSKCDLIT